MNYAPDGSPITQTIVACARKKPFVSEPLAWSAIFNMRARGQDTERLLPYECQFCGVWHLGRTPARLRYEIDAARAREREGTL